TEERETARLLQRRLAPDRVPSPYGSRALLVRRDEEKRARRDDGGRGAEREHRAAHGHARGRGTEQVREQRLARPADGAGTRAPPERFDRRRAARGSLRQRAAHHAAA